MSWISFATLMDRLRNGEPLGIEAAIVTHDSLGPRDVRDGRAFPLPQGRDVTIGRHKGADVVLPVAEVSRQHVKLGVRKGASRRFSITDLGTRNGTNVNGRELPRGRPVAVLEPVVSLRLAERTSVSVMDERSLTDYLWLLIRMNPA